MKRLTWFLAAALLVAFSIPAFAGDGKACSASTQECLNHFSSYKGKGWVGIEMDYEGEAMIVKTVVANSPAYKAGFQVGDQLVELNGAKMNDKDAMKKAKGEWKAGQQATYTVLRKGAEKKLAITLGEMPESVYAQMVGAHMIHDHMATAQTADAK